MEMTNQDQRIENVALALFEVEVEDLSWDCAPASMKCEFRNLARVALAMSQGEQETVQPEFSETV